jgi:nucleotide-binding universal stress UspA family protein
MSGIIVGTDGSRYSQHALDWAMREAAIHQVPLTVVTVYQAAAGFWSGKPSHPEKDDPGRHARSIAQEQTDKALGQLGGLQPPSVAVQAVHGIPAEELMKAARDADMLVVAARGTGGFARLHLGSVSTHLAHHARCPVVIIPLDDDHR